MDATRAGSQRWKSALACLIGVLDDNSLGEPRLYIVIVYDFLTESISPCFRALVHFDAHGVLLTSSFLKGCDGLLCHGVSDSRLLNFLVDRHFSQNRIVFLQFHPIWSVFAIFRRDIPGRAGHAGIFVLGAL